MTLHIKDGNSLSRYLRSIMEESVRNAKRKRAILREADDDADEGDDDAGEGIEINKQNFKELSDDDYKALEKGEITANDIIEKLNSIRSGKSFKDEEVNASMEQYVEDLNKAEKTALLAFLKGISQIVTAEIPAPEAVEPSEKPSSVKMEKGPPAPRVLKIKPSIIRKRPDLLGDEEKKKKPSPEDTSGPVPIKPKKK